MAADFRTERTQTVAANTQPDYTEEGAKMGTSLGNMAKGVYAGLRLNQREQNQMSTQKLLADYNDPSSTTFQGLDGSPRTLKLAELLLPIDRGMSETYRTRAEQERQKDLGAEFQQKFKDATEFKNKSDLAELDAEIASVEEAISKMEGGEPVSTILRAPSAVSTDLGGTEASPPEITPPIVPSEGTSASPAPGTSVPGASPDLGYTPKAGALGVTPPGEEAGYPLADYYAPKAPPAPMVSNLGSYGPYGIGANPLPPIVPAATQSPLEQTLNRIRGLGSK